VQYQQCSVATERGANLEPYCHISDSILLGNLGFCTTNSNNRACVLFVLALNVALDFSMATLHCAKPRFIAENHFDLANLAILFQRLKTLLLVA
jgi:hypothetical protein